MILDFSKPLVMPPPGTPFCGLAMRKRTASGVDWSVKGGTLDDLAQALGVDLDRIVVNKTGLTGKFDFHLEFAVDETTAGLNALRVGPGAEPAFPQPTASDPPGGPSIFTALAGATQVEVGVNQGRTGKFW